MVYVLPTPCTPLAHAYRSDRLLSLLQGLSANPNVADFMAVQSDAVDGFAVTDLRDLLGRPLPLPLPLGPVPATASLPLAAASLPLAAPPDPLPSRASIPPSLTYPVPRAPGTLPLPGSSASDDARWEAVQFWTGEIDGGRIAQLVTEFREQVSGWG